MMKKLAFVLCVVLTISMCSFSFAEEMTNAPTEVVVTPAPVVEPTKAPEKPAEATKAPAAVPTVTVTMEPVVTEEATEEPVATEEATEEPVVTEEATEQPEVTEEVTEEAAEEPVATEEITEEATEEPVVERKVLVTVDAPAELHYGDHVTLNAELIGYEGATYTMQWQFSHDGTTWTDAQGANSTSYTFEVNEDTANTMWRLVVTVL